MLSYRKTSSSRFNELKKFHNYGSALLLTTQNLHISFVDSCVKFRDIAFFRKLFLFDVICIELAKLNIS